jgi:hypothetical protein
MKAAGSMNNPKKAATADSGAIAFAKATPATPPPKNSSSVTGIVTDADR